MNSVTINRQAIHPKHNKALDTFARRILPFAFSFLHIEADGDTHVAFVRMPIGSNGMFSRRSGKNGRRYRIFLNQSLVAGSMLKNVFFHEMAHFRQSLDGVLDGCSPGAFDHSDEGFSAYYNDPVEVEAREMAEVMEYSFSRYENNYRGNVPCMVTIEQFCWMPSSRDRQCFPSD